MHSCIHKCNHLQTGNQSHSINLIFPTIFFLVQKSWHNCSSKGLTANEGPGRRMYRCFPPGRETSVWFFWSDATYQLFQIKFGPSLVLLGGEVQYCSPGPWCMAGISLYLAGSLLYLAGIAWYLAKIACYLIGLPDNCPRLPYIWPGLPDFWPGLPVIWPGLPDIWPGLPDIWSGAWYLSEFTWYWPRLPDIWLG